MDRRTLSVVFLTMGIFLAWQYFRPGGLTGTPPPAATTTAQPAASAPAVSKSANVKEVQQSLAVFDGNAVVANVGPLLRNWTLTGYRSREGKNLVSLEEFAGVPGAVELGFDDQEFLYLKDQAGAVRSDANGATWTFEDSKVKVTREYRVEAGKPYLDLTLNMAFKGKAPKNAFVSLTSRATGHSDLDVDRKLVYGSGETVESQPITKDIALGVTPAPVRWIGATERYFLLSVLPAGKQEVRASMQSLGTGAGQLSLIYPIEGNTISIPLRVFFGPKNVNVLRSVDATLDRTVDFGWFTLFAYPLLRIMQTFYTFVKNYGVAIILLTLLVKLVTYPLTYKSMKNMKQMAKLNPVMQRVRERYKDDPTRMNRELMTLMKTNGYNPLMGCLPILVQMPIFFALYRVLYSSVELYQAPFMLWIMDLSAKDPYYVTPVLLTGVMFLQQKLTPAASMDPAQQKMLQFMPIIFGVMMINLPSGLTLYMVINAVASIFQQIFLNKKFDLQTNAAPAGA